MSKKTSYILGILLTIILGTILYYYLCCSICCGKDNYEHKATETNKVIEPKAPVAPKIKAATKNAFTITDANSDFSITDNDNFNFKTSSFIILSPVSENVTKKVEDLKAYLLENPSKTIDITGFYKSDETNNSAYPNLGLARANSIKNYLVNAGISSKQIDTKGQLNDAIYPDETKTLFGPVTFNVLTETADTTAMDALKTACDALRANPLVLHFKTGQAAINLTAAQRQKIADISHCVDRLGVKVQVVGHTDNTGNAANNIILGQNRADFAKNYLIKNGILETNIETASKGSNEPIADNATDEGQSKNRRTVVTIN